MASSGADVKRDYAEAETESIATSIAPSSIYDNASLAPTDATIGEEPQDPSQNFTAAGRPMPNVKHSMSAYPHIGNSLPVKFKDTSFVSIPIPQADIDEALAGGPVEQEDEVLPTYGQANRPSTNPEPEKKSLMSVFKTKSKDKAPKKPAFQMVKMMRSEYLAYFAKGDKGEFVCSVPRDTGDWKSILRMRLDDSELQDKGRDDTRFAHGGSWKDGVGLIGIGGFSGGGV